MAGSDESKYAHLLQPIRDLAGNWDINVADELEEYLEVLESVTFSFEDGPSLNFAEAALVIQGSACVYGKKVEYLHSLVIQALQFMSEKRRYQDKSRDSNDQTADAGSDQAEEDAFAVLDDFWQGEEDIDLDPASQAQPAQSSKPPAILLALNDSGIDTGDGDAGNYRVSKCLVHTSGALLLDPADMLLYDESLDLADSSHSSSTSLAPPSGQLSSLGAAAQLLASGRQPDGNAMLEAGNGTLHTSMQHIKDQDMPASEWDAGGLEGDHNDDDDSGGAGDIDHYDGGEYAHMDASAPAGVLHEAAGAPDAQLLQCASMQCMAAGPAAAQEAARAPSNDGEEELWDPYAPLNPSSPGVLAVAPFKKGRAPTNRHRRRKKQTDVAQQRPGPLSGLSMGSIIPPAAHPDKLTFPEFAYALPAHTQRSGKRARQAAQDQTCLPSEQHTAAQLNDAAAWQHDGHAGAEQLSAFDPAPSHAQPLEPEPDDAGPDDYGYDAGDGDMGPEDDRSDHGDVPDLAALELAATWMGGQWDAAAPDAPPGTSLMALDSQGPSYEDLCRAHIEAFIDAAAAAEVQTELAARVGEWQGKVCTVLEEQDARPPFDLQAYGTGLLDRLSDLSLREGQDMQEGQACGPVGFGAVVEGQEPHEVARSFSALLQLVNNGNVQLNQGLTTTSPFSLQLRSLELQQDRMAQHGASELMLSKDASRAYALSQAVEGQSSQPAAACTSGGSKKGAVKRKLK
ncbi:hypothetical protein WJX74_004538 [Apatococcus lobatus]|uniref:Condensin-2 complex subunit H2 n=1 Tax=Apatococcus lobatus TaxID=904363 RepID=A0AAW1SGL9_9CHLO